MNDQATLLIVDDEKHNRTLLLELLKDSYQIIFAKNGRQALELAATHRPDLILLDVLMPEMDGYQTINALKADEASRDIPVIFISALDSADDEAQGLELGAADYITKPFHPSIVRARIRNHLQILQQRRQLEQLSLVDSLTEIPNRRRFSQVLEQEWRRCLRKQEPLSLVVVDVDHFKLYNDSHGHAIGDNILYLVAQTLSHGLRRASDFVARYGGEEFVMLLPESEASEAQVLVERIRQDINDQQLEHRSSPVAPWITLSFGGATVIPDTHEVDSEFFCRADACLYQAKHQGRNRAVWADGLDVARKAQELTPLPG
jgi:diguanylate cyclase (GGDEF)-like protein